MHSENEDKDWPFISDDVYASHLLEHLENGQLLNCSGNLVDAAKAFRNKRIILYYFSASWCGPCKALLPKLKEIYLKGRAMDAGLETIYISSDSEPDVMVQYFKERHGGWYAVPFGDAGAESMRLLYGVKHIPQIIVVKNDGTVISRHGVKDINTLGLNVIVAWNSDPV